MAINLPQNLQEKKNETPNNNKLIIDTKDDCESSMLTYIYIYIEPLSCETINTIYQPKKSVKKT